MPLILAFAALFLSAPHGQFPQARTTSIAAAGDFNAVDFYSFMHEGGAYTTLAKPADLAINVASATFTANAWFKRTTAADFQRCIISKAQMNSGLITLFLGVTADEKVYVLAGGGNNTSGGDISDHGWHMATVTIGGGNGKLYVDGVQVGVTFAVGTDVNTASDWMVGAARYSDNTDNSYEFIGNIDEVTTWSGTMTAAQVAELYHNGVPLNPTKHSLASSLTHYYPVGDGDSYPTMSDNKASSNGTVTNTWNVKLTKHSPTFTPSSLAFIDESDAAIDMHFKASAWDGSGNWNSSVGLWTGIKTSSPVRSAVSQFTGGHYQTTCGGWFRVANDALNVVTTTSKFTYIIRMFTGDLNGSGGFYAGYDATAFTKSGFQIYNFFYAEDLGARLRKSDDSGDYLAAEAHTSAHTSKYITAGVTIDMTVPRIRAYVNGSLIASATVSSGAYAVHTSAPLGICGVAYSDASGYVSTAANQKIMEVARWRREFTAAEMASQAAEWNALKGY